jgi:hypothetical protein
VNPPNLTNFLKNLTHLTISNLGLPNPSTHLSVLIKLAQPTLEYFAISSVRDVELREFRNLFKILSDSSCSRLSTLVLGFLTDEQVTALTLPTLIEEEEPHHDQVEEEDVLPVLSKLSNLTSLTFTLPHPSIELLLSIPPSLETLTIRPPYSRSALPPSSSTITGTSSSSSCGKTVITGHSKKALLAVLNPVPSPSITTPLDTNGTNTPQQQLSLSGGSNIINRRVRTNRRSLPLELLEEEENILNSLSLALGNNPPKLQRRRSSESFVMEEEIQVLRKGETMLCQERLKKIRWECKGLRGGKERVQEIMNERERYSKER